MSWDSRIVIISVLSFAIFGVANLFGQVGHFVPPLILDYFLIVVISAIFLFRTKPTFAWWLLLMYFLYSLSQAGIDNSVHAMLSEGFELQKVVDALDAQGKILKTLSKAGLVLSLILFAAMTFIRLWERDVRDPLGRYLYSGMIFFILMMNVFAFLVNAPQVRNVAFLGIGFVSILLVIRHDQLKMQDAEKRFLLLLSLTFLLDAMQMMSLFLLRN